MSEISDEGRLPPNVHHPRPEKPASTDEEADRERVEEDAEGDGGEPRRDERADRQPPAGASGTGAAGTAEPPD